MANRPIAMPSQPARRLLSVNATIPMLTRQKTR